jgi:cold shock CspA family protein
MRSKFVTCQAPKPAPRSTIVSNRCFGTISTVNLDRGFAFFRADHGIDCFVHFKDFLKAGLAEPKVGGRYSFTVEPTAKGPRAVNLGVE